MTNCTQAAKKIGEPARPVPTPKSFPSPGNTDLSSIDHVRPLSTPDLNAQYRSSKESSYTLIAGPRNDFAVPTLAELGIPEATTPHRGGENIALKTLDAIIQNEDYTATFEKPNTAPTAFNPQSTTLLSPHHHFGSLSVREVYWRVREVLVAYKKKKKTPSQPPTSLIGQLQFRDMYFGAQTQLGYAFAQCTTNSSCRFLDWHLPSTLDPKTNLLDGKHTIDSLEAEAWLHRWRNGITGFPWIDGLMRQLRDEGWIHHLGRHAVACFLTRGGCYIHWERGAEVFEEWLIDHETACNAGNWQWLSCTAFFAQFYRCYSPIKFPQNWDKNGDFVRHYVPELVKFDTKYIYEPWKAPIADQKKWGCMIKGDGSTTEEDGKKVYPKPMLDFDERRDICMGAMKKGYGIRMYGDDPKVLDGSWREIFGVLEGKEAAWNGIDENGAGEKRKRRGTGREDEDTAEDDGFEKAHEDAEKLARKGQKTHFNRAMNGQGTLDAMVSRTNAKH
jgi:cryptochrome